METKFSFFSWEGDIEPSEWFDRIMLARMRSIYRRDIIREMIARMDGGF